ncbi:hypothetical protein N8987_01690 [Crocinitomix sp.]|nr:hypothetical protein [Crocinitomix sp.]
MKKLIMLVMVVGLTATATAQTGEFRNKVKQANQESTQKVEKADNDASKQIVVKKEATQAVKQDVKAIEKQATDEVKKIKSEEAETIEAVTESVVEEVVEERGEMTADRANNATTNAKAKSEQAGKKVTELEASITGTEDKIAAARARVQTALDNKDIKAKDAEAKFAKINEAQAKVDATKAQIADEKAKIESLNNLIGGK